MLRSALRTQRSRAPAFHAGPVRDRPLKHTARGGRHGGYTAHSASGTGAPRRPRLRLDALPDVEIPACVHPAAVVMPASARALQQAACGGCQHRRGRNRDAPSAAQLSGQASSQLPSVSVIPTHRFAAEMLALTVLLSSSSTVALVEVKV